MYKEKKKLFRFIDFHSYIVKNLFRFSLQEKYSNREITEYHIKLHVCSSSEQLETQIWRKNRVST